jgi:membrane protease YdiL (CAAX protease family)
MPSLDPTGSVPLVPLPARPDGQWSVAGAFGFVVLVLGAAILAGYGLQTWLLGARTGLDPFSGSALGNPREFVLVQLAGQLLELALIWWLAGVWHTHRAAALNLRPAGLSPRGWIGMILLLFLVKILVTAATSEFGTSSPREEIAPFLELTRQRDVWLLFPVTVILAAVTEELLFRGVLSRTLEATRMGFWFGAGITSGAFALLHVQYGVGGQIVIFAIGMTLAWIRATTGSLWPAMVCHAVNNAVALLAMRVIA